MAYIIVNEPLFLSCQYRLKYMDFGEIWQVELGKAVFAKQGSCGNLRERELPRDG